VYDGFRFTSIASLGEEVEEAHDPRERSLQVALDDRWRIGYVAADKDLVAAMNNIQSQSTSNPCPFCDKASIEALNGPQDFLKGWVAEFDRRSPLHHRPAQQDTGGVVPASAGGVLRLPELLRCYGKKTPAGKVIDGSSALSAYLLDDYKVGGRPWDRVRDDACQRLSYATSMKNIEKGIDRIEQAVKALA